MNTRTYELLKILHRRHGPRRFGKLCQKLLAIALSSAGYERIVEREVQGVDVDAGGANGAKYAIEVKTTKGEHVRFEEKDLEGLKRRAQDGYSPVLAVLRLRVLADWVFAKADDLSPGSIHVATLRAHRLPELENAVSDCFDRVLQEHFDGVLRDAQKYLNHVLSQWGIEWHSDESRI